MPRMSLVSPREMCSYHLTVEHYHMHVFAGIARKGRSLNGWAKSGCVLPSLIFIRHDVLAQELERRMYRHRSPLVPFDVLAGEWAEAIDVSAFPNPYSACPACRLARADWQGEQRANFIPLLEPGPIAPQIGGHTILSQRREFW